jgi:hypothetical protein
MFLKFFRWLLRSDDSTSTLTDCPALKNDTDGQIENRITESSAPLPPPEDIMEIERYTFPDGKPRGTAYIGDHYTGIANDSPNGRYSIVVSPMSGSEDKTYWLLQDGKVLCHGREAKRICDHKAFDCGVFVIELYGGTQNTRTKILDKSGALLQQRLSTDKKQWMLIGISQDGEESYWEMDGKEIVGMRISDNTRAFKFTPPVAFCATKVVRRPGANELEIQHRGGEYFRFSLKGKPLEKERLANHISAIMDGPSLFKYAWDHFSNSDRSPDAARAAIKCIEQALKKGIEDSYSVKKAFVYERLAFLQNLVGNNDSSSTALKNAEDSLDGFRLVDRTVARVEKEGVTLLPDDIRKLISDLNRALQTERLHDYPNYTGRLYRCQAELYERLGETTNAIVAFRQALQCNPKAGCKKALDRLLAVQEKSSPSNVSLG